MLILDIVDNLFNHWGVIWAINQCVPNDMTHVPRHTCAQADTCAANWLRIKYTSMWTLNAVTEYFISKSLLLFGFNPQSPEICLNKPREQTFFQLWNHHKCLSLPFLLHLNRGGLGKLGHFLYFDTVCFSHLSYYTVSCGFEKHRPCRTFWSLFYFIFIMLHRKNMWLKKYVTLT